MPGKFHICLEERIQIERLIKEGKGYIEIAEFLARQVQAIRNEIEKNGGFLAYNAGDAEKKAADNRHFKKVRPRAYKVVNPYSIKQEEASPKIVEIQLPLTLEDRVARLEHELESLQRWLSHPIA